ncbi:hypothetical protein [Xanthocytophaga agilis]|uniref:Uncharacterized protein n=1 Tax=Xanthocytophaga agilis TaxID=3048010 RepID=A0AAE3UEF6_9BACT|nr:hypothetical protein [Xanthocytophaga agilis]MDJ1502738.1 hypothetical protein [Xanthocytophaga agilis]
MQTLPIYNESGQIIHNVPFRQYILNHTQQFAVVALEIDKLGGLEKILELVPGIEYIHMGKLDDLEMELGVQVIHTLIEDLWDFEKYHNPDIVLITDKRN